MDKTTNLNEFMKHWAEEQFSELYELSAALHWSIQVNA